MAKYEQENILEIGYNGNESWVEFDLGNETITFFSGDGLHRLNTYGPYPKEASEDV